MPRLRPTSGVFLIVALAALGFLLVYVPPKILEQYDRVKSLGPPWTYFYFVLVGTGAAILLVLTISVGWKLWRATRLKDKRREGLAKDPSQLSAEQKEREVADNLAVVGDLQARDDLPDDVKRKLQALVDRVEEKLADLETLYDLVHGEVEDAALDVAATLRSVRRGNGMLGRVRRLLVAGRS